MVDTYSPNLALTLQETGTNSGTWGTITNTNLGTLIEQAISGYVTQAITDGAATVITIPNGATGVARNMTLELTGALTAARVLEVPANKKLYFIYNNTTGGYAVTVKVSGQTGVSVPNGKKMILVSNGTDIVEAVNYAGTISGGSLTLTGNLSVGGTSGFTGVATFTAQPIMSSLTASQAVFTDGSKGLVSNAITGTGNVVMSNSPTLVTPALGTPSSCVVTNFTGTASININGTVGATTPTTGAFTTLSASSSVTFSGGTANGVVYLNGSKVATSGSGLVFDGSNLGLGVTPSAWSAETKGFQLGSYGVSLSDAAGYQCALANNAYYNSGWKYKATGYAPALYTQNTGSHQWFNAPSGTAGNPITFTQAMTLDASGNLGLGVTSVAAVGSQKVFAVGNSSGGTVAHYQSGALVYCTSATSSNVDFYNPNATPIIWYTNATEKMRLDASGNLGLGVTPSAWSSTYKAIQLPSSTYGGGSLISDAGSPAIVANAYSNTGWKYVNNDYATIYQSRSGQHQWYTAPSGTAGDPITFTQAMTLDASGNLGIGTTSPGSKLEVVGNLRITNPTITNSAIFQVISDATGSNGVNLEATYYGSGGYGPIKFTTSGTERMRLDASGNLGLGVTPSAWGSAFKAMQIGRGTALWSGTATDATFLSQNAYYDGSAFKYIQSAYASYYSTQLGSHYWYTAPSGTAGDPITFTQAMTLDASGNLMVGTTTPIPTANGISILPSSAVAIGHATGTASGNYYVGFYYNGTAIGSITQNGTTGVLYNITSDQRLKTNIVNAPDASLIIDSIKVRSFDWLIDGSHQRYGMVAQELLEVAPEAVSVPTDDDEMMGVDYSKLVPILVKEIQSLRARVANLEKL